MTVYKEARKELDEIVNEVKKAEIESIVKNTSGKKDFIFQNHKLIISLNEKYVILPKTKGALGSYSDVNVIDIDQKKILYSLNGKQFVFSPNSKLLAFYYNQSIMLVDVITGKKVQTYSLKAPDPMYSDFFSPPITFSHDNNKVASVDGLYVIKIFDTQNKQKIMSIPGHSSILNSITFSKNGEYLASSGSDNKLMLWNISSNGKLLHSIHLGSSELTSLKFVNDDKTISGIDRNYIIYWDVLTGKEAKRIDIGEMKAFSNDYKISASIDGNNILLWDITSHKNIGQLSGHSDIIKSISFSKDGRFLISGSADNTIKIWDYTNKVEVATLIGLEGEKFVVTTPDNYYMASQKKIDAVGFRLGHRAYPFEQFDLRLNRPDIVLQRIGYASKDFIDANHNAYKRRLKKMGFTEEILSNESHLPEIEIQTNNLPLLSEQKNIRFTVRAYDSKEFLDRLNVFINDVPIYGMRGIDLKSKKSGSYHGEIEIELSYGENKIQVSVLNQRGTESLKETFKTTYNRQQIKPDLYIVGIGVSDYINKDNIRDLKYADKDAKDMVNFFLSKSENFGETKPLLILNQNATIENILGIKDILKQSKPDDEIVLFLSGHGLLDNELNYYFATTDIEPQNPNKRGLPYEKIEELLDGIPARKKLLLMDTCHSGEVDKEESKVVVQNFNLNDKSVNIRNVIPLNPSKPRIGLDNSIILLNELFADLRRTSGAMVISSAGGFEFALEKEQLRNGVFTYAILQGLNGKADLNNDGEIRVSELRDYVADEVEKLTDKKQRPTMRRENLEYDFRIF